MANTQANLQTAIRRNVQSAVSFRLGFFLSFKMGVVRAEVLPPSGAEKNSPAKRCLRSCTKLARRQCRQCSAALCTPTQTSISRLRTLYLSQYGAHSMRSIILSQRRLHKIGVARQDLGALTIARVRDFRICWGRLFKI